MIYASSTLTNISSLDNILFEHSRYGRGLYIVQVLNSTRQPVNKHIICMYLYSDIILLLSVCAATTTLLSLQQETANIEKEMDTARKSKLLAKKASGRRIKST